MSFYVTLPSNGPTSMYPKNTLSHFQTLLSSPIQLDGDYEVGLTEIMFPYNWQFRRNGKMVFLKDGQANATLELRFYVYDSIHMVIQSINDFTKHSNVPVQMQYNTTTHKVSIQGDVRWEVEFTDECNMEFGYKYPIIQFAVINDQIDANYPIAEQMNSIKALYIYSDICEYQHVGDAFVPLLRAVAVDNAVKYGEYVNKIYTAPHYVPVMKRNFNSIEIDIKTDYSERIHFGFGKVFVQLHFRQKRIF